MDLNNFLYNQPDKPEPLTGSVLVSEPMTHDSYFGRSAILILDVPEPGGHLGLLLNKGTTVTLADLMPDWEKGREVPVFCGGPVDMQRMFLIHSLGERLKGSYEILPGLYVGADVNAVIDYIENDGEIDGKLRFFLGYCGWSPGQLAGEIKRNSWAINNHREVAGLLEGQGTDYWRKEVERLGEAYRSWLMVPTDPSLN